MHNKYTVDKVKKNEIKKQTKKKKAKKKKHLPSMELISSAGNPIFTKLIVKKHLILPV